MDNSAREKWMSIAERFARQALEEWFSTHWGVHDVEGRHIVIFSNHPYAFSPARRDRELEGLRSYFLENGIQELAFATYPRADGAEAGHTYAMVVASPIVGSEAIADAFGRIVVNLLHDPRRGLSAVGQSGE